MKRHHPLWMLLISLSLQLVFNYTWLLFNYLLHPPAPAYGHAQLGGPGFAVMIMSIYALVATMITYPFLYFAFRERKLRVAIPILV